MIGGAPRSPADPGAPRREVQSELAGWVRTGPGSWEQRPRVWGSVPLRDERHGAAEVEKVNKEKRKEWLDELRFDASLEAYNESASREGHEAQSSDSTRSSE